MIRDKIILPPAPAPAVTGPPEAAILPSGTTLADALRELIVVVPKLKDALKRPPVERLTYRLDDVAAALGVSRRAIERELSAGRFPRADLHIGKAPLWRVETVRDWLDSRKGGSR